MKCPFCKTTMASVYLNPGDLEASQLWYCPSCKRILRDQDMDKEAQAE